MKTKKTFIKLIIFGAILFFTILLIKKTSPPDTDNYFVSIADEISNSKEGSYYFIGSSRVQKSINPELLKVHFDNENIYNMGISASTFLSNCALAEFLIINKKPKVLFIELSPILPELPEGLLKFSDEVDFDVFRSINSLNKHESIHQKILINLNQLNNYTFSKISLKDDLKKILGLKDQQSNKRAMGFVSLKGNSFNSTSKFITYREINSFQRKSNKSNSHENYINHLLELGIKKNTKIVFFLPITYQREKEKSITVPIFNMLSDSLKIKYSEKFIAEITKAKYLSDSNHFNNIGAEKYTELLYPLIESYFTN
ncbi:hypothetical protein [Aquimarina algiphila]|uniref:DUF1574 domain-containing protein n=1 Tax=Aquimarina algiphila TaxID=2047982 RepID=A0A554VKS4_9FLAO|nr:hypothetical protein [Aquimarina algiphila]TSE08637.1 hypothetical protein FOF46_11835 [Aquimarina algiphila]